MVRIDLLGGSETMRHVVSSTTVADAGLGLTPLSVQSAVEAVMTSGLGTLVQFALLVFTIVLSIGGLFLIGAAGMARLSQDSGRQGNVGQYLTGALIVFGIAAVLGAGPEIMSELGMQTFDHISPVSVFQSGGGGGGSAGAGNSSMVSPPSDI